MTQDDKAPNRLVQNWHDMGAELKVHTMISVEDVPCLVVEDSGGSSITLEFDGKDFIWPTVRRSHE